MQKICKDKIRIYSLPTKLVLKFQKEAGEFIRQYSSNVLEAPRNAFVDIQGRIVAVFDQKMVSADEVLVVIEAKFMDRLEKHLSKYLFLTGTEMQKLDTRVYFDLDGGYEPTKDEFVIVQKHGQLILSRNDIVSTVSEEAFTLFRVQNNIPVQGVDFDNELLLNVGNEEFISYTKGCYLGQEIIARVHHRSKPPKKLVVAAQNELPEAQLGAMTSVCVDPKQPNSPKGFVFIS